MADVSRLKLIGPHPLQLARTTLFLGARRARRAWLRRRYDALVEATRPRGELRLPRVDLCRTEQLPTELRHHADALCAEAELILQHRVDYLGSGIVALGDEIDWHRDFKSGYRWAPLFYQDVETTRLDDDSDAKVPWELSRGHQLLTLARAARLTGDDRFAHGLSSQLQAWLRANPAGRGINWVTPMELGIRSVNWLWAAATLEPESPLVPELRSQLARSLHWHARHIAANLEGTPALRSNHYLGDILGLLAIGAAFPSDPFSRRWYRYAQRAFEREILRQVYPDGVGFEGSHGYHGLCLEMYLVARAVAEMADRPFSRRFDGRLQQMVDVSVAARHPDGRQPLFGDSDSGRVLPGGFERRATHDELIWIAAALLGGERPFDGPPSPEVAWTLGVDAYRNIAQRHRRERSAPTAFPVGGLYVLGGGGTHLVVRCGDVGQNGAGGHAHNDMLSYELSRTVPLIVDSGTYAYTFDVAARNVMRSSAAHNVLVVDGQEINPIDPSRIFNLPQRARATVHRWHEGPDETVLTVSHDGYLRLVAPVSVTRTFVLDRVTGSVEVRDELHGTGRHRIDRFVHFAPGVEVSSHGDDCHLATRGRHGVTVAFEQPGGDVALDAAWVSERYGHRERAAVLIASAEVELPVTLSYRIEAGEWSPMPSPQQANATPPLIARATDEGR